MFAQFVAKVLTILGPKLIEWCTTLINKFKRKQKQAKQANENNQRANDYESNSTTDNHNSLP